MITYELLIHLQLFTHMNLIFYMHHTTIPNPGPDMVFPENSNSDPNQKM